MVAAAVIGGAIIGGAATASAGHEAASATSRGAKNAVAEQRAARESNERMSAPYRQLGEKAMSTYEDLLGIGSKGAAGIQETLSNLPGYQFAKTQGIEGTSRALAAQGLNLSGNQAQGLADYTTGLADQTYGAQLDRLLAPIGIGQASAAGQAASNQQSANNISGIQQSQGNTMAGIRAGTISGVNNAVQGGINGLVTNHTLDSLNSTGTAMPPPQIPYPTNVPTYGS